MCILFTYHPATAKEINDQGQLQVNIPAGHNKLGNIFRIIEKQTGLVFTYNSQHVNIDEEVTFNKGFANARLQNVLEVILLPRKLLWTYVGKNIALRPAAADKVSSGITDTARLITVSGRIIDKNGEPVPNATIVAKGTNKGTTTDLNGLFQISNVGHNTLLIISNVAFLTEEISVKSRSSLGNIQLREYVEKLDETVVIAYGKTTNRLNPGNVSVVKAADIEKQPVTNPLLALAGRVPGLFISQATGLPGSGVSVQIQGQNSVFNGNDPFYVIDGVPYTSQMLPNIGGSLLGISGKNNAQGGNPLNYINPADIENISVLKDADATAIYGSRAANGAILITTKKGKPGKTKFDLNIQHGFGRVAGRLNLLNTEQYLEMRHEALKNDGLNAGPGDYDVNGTWDTTKNTDWQKKLIGKMAQYTNIGMNVSGGTATTQYLIGTSYHRETVVFPGSFADQKGSLLFNINSATTNEKLRFTLSGNYAVDDNQLPFYDFTNSAILLAPNAPDLHNPDGSLNWAQTSYGASTWTNPMAQSHNKYRNKTNNLISSASISYTIIPGLDIRSSFAYTNQQSDETTIFPLTSTSPENRPYTPRYALYSNNNINSWVIEPQVSFKRTLRNIGDLEALIGITIQENNGKGQILYGQGYNSDKTLGNIQAASSISSQGVVASTYRYNAFFGRINYNRNSRYLLNLTARRDGSSRFGSATRFNNFGAAGIGWIFSNEAFFSNIKQFINFGKLKASYGTTGNDQIGDYKYLNLYSPTSAQVAYQGYSGLEANGLPNPYLQWEETRKLNLGADIGLLKDRILLNVNYFRNRSSNQLLPYTLSIVSGAANILRNFPAVVENSGWEFSLNAEILKSDDLNWSGNVNLTIPKNKLLAFPGLANSSYANSLLIGEPVTIRRIYHFSGVDPITGVYQFSDSKGNPTTTPDGTSDNIAVINTAPQFYGGFENSFTCKGFELTVMLQFVRQKGPDYRFGNMPGVMNQNQPVYIQDRWQKEGDVASIQRYNSNYSLAGQYYNTVFFSDAGYSDASYIRLRNLSFSWKLPKIWLENANMQNARIYVQGQNLLTITNYKGLDPETKSSSTLPPLQILTFGLQVSL